MKAKQICKEVKPPSSDPADALPEPNQDRDQAMDSSKDCLGEAPSVFKNALLSKQGPEQEQQPENPVEQGDNGSENCDSEGGEGDEEEDDNDDADQIQDEDEMEEGDDQS